MAEVEKIKIIFLLLYQKQMLDPSYGLIINKTKLRNLNVNKAIGVDDVHARILKECSEKANEHNIPVDIAFFDFAKAFDSVPHERLCIKLENLGVKDELLGWCKAFSNKRKQSGNGGLKPIRRRRLCSELAKRGRKNKNFKNPHHTETRYPTVKINK
ncbi:hypothetical protein HELRODRAFT_184235 [Helobdella robusta]|uniref:Uncharacterized protein n=1 Tax=Helobdella robusta TaxID=6412 RepID=T1FKT6_HELRO|nr:hypothetical protein HELRODRAFT_184235 [Helobdella robusta]ESO04491.1 hypothetical protein HELRODRAFT_184235 [Helobdella robusta]